MDFEIDDITQQVAQTARDFAHKYIRPHVMEWDEPQHFPVEVFKELGKLGLMGILVPEAQFLLIIWLSLTAKQPWFAILPIPLIHHKKLWPF